MIEIINLDPEYAYFYYKGYGIGLPTKWLDKIDQEKYIELMKAAGNKAKEQRNSIIEQSRIDNILITHILSAPVIKDENWEFKFKQINSHEDKEFLVTISRGLSIQYKMEDKFDIETLREGETSHITLESSEREKSLELIQMFVQHLNFIDSLGES